MLCDRYPLPGTIDIDGPRVDQQQASGMTGLRRRSVEFERTSYGRIRSPDSLVVLRIDPEVAVARRPEADPTTGEKSCRTHPHRELARRHAGGRGRCLSRACLAGREDRDVDEAVTSPPPEREAGRAVDGRGHRTPGVRQEHPRPGDRRGRLARRDDDVRQPIREDGCVHAERPIAVADRPAGSCSEVDRPAALRSDGPAGCHADAWQDRGSCARSGSHLRPGAGLPALSLGARPWG